jgi:hypothetical protein
MLPPRSRIDQEIDDGIVPLAVDRNERARHQHELGSHQNLQLEGSGAAERRRNHVGVALRLIHRLMVNRARVERIPAQPSGRTNVDPSIADGRAKSLTLPVTTPAVRNWFGRNAGSWPISTFATLQRHV